VPTPFGSAVRRSPAPWRSLRALAVALVAAARLTAAVADDPVDPRALFEEAVRLFFAAEPAASARTFDRLVAAVPDAEPELWQRGLALYYAGRFQDGRVQFERHRTVNPDDVENPAWHFLCVARLDGPEAARKALLPVGADARVPMREILALYAGRGTAADVLAAAEQGEGAARRNHLCYAHLYLGLHAEATGDDDRAREHILQAAGPFRMDHYMGKVAVVHARLRGWADAEAPALKPQR
jgi:lipoprotein NlpI